MSALEKMFEKFTNMSLKFHLFIGFVIRSALILYGEYHDRHFELPFTDVDYKVFTDAARHVLNGESPYKCHTYRYSPIIAFLMIPNVIFSNIFGKLIFCFCDLLVTIAVRRFVELQLAGLAKVGIIANIAKLSCLFWLYNPMSIAISTRGNADSFPSIFIILSLLFLHSNCNWNTKYIMSGVLLGVSIHLRIYPLVFSFPMYLSLGCYNKIRRGTRIKDALLAFIPNRSQISLFLSCVTTLSVLTYFMYSLYGYDFLYETYLYHALRKDVRHNFSLLFYSTYLTNGQLNFDLVKLACTASEMLVLFVVSLVFGCTPKTLPFAVFCQSVVLVIYNSVMTSQYFIWFLSLMPLVVHSLKISLSKAVLLVVAWFLSQGFWLFYAYELEFRSACVFFMIGLAGMVFFITNSVILSVIIRNYNVDYGFGKMSKKVD